MRAVLLIGAAALALAACQKSPGAAASAPTASADSGSSAPAGGAPVGGVPHRRSGLWTQTMSRDGKTFSMGGVKVCVDEAMEAQESMFKFNGRQSGGRTNCTRTPPTRGLDGSFSFSATCTLASGGQMVTKGAASGDWSSSFHMEIQDDTTGAPIPTLNGHHVTDIDGKWVGPCPAGMAGGDMQFANGMTVSGGKMTGAAKMTGGGAASAPGQ
jgi:uncharacterized protein (DUF2147 family)